MSDVNLDFTVSNNSIEFTTEPNDITITPTDIQLTISSNSIPIARGSNTQVQYNNDGILDGSSTFTFDNVSNVVSITNGVIANANIQNGTINASNITSAFTNLGNVGNVKITGGTNGYVLQTDGTGNLDWTAMGGGGGGNGTPGGSNTQIQYNDAGTFGGNAGFTFNEITGNVNMPSNLNVTLITNTATLLSQVMTATGSIQGGNILSLGNVTASGSLLTPNAIANLVNANFIQLQSTNVALGSYSGGSGPGTYGQDYAAIAIGTLAGANSQGQESIAIGYQAGYQDQQGGAVAIGAGAGSDFQGNGAIAIGSLAGGGQQGNYAIAIGAGAGADQAGNVPQASNSIILNATGVDLDQTTANTFTVKPVRNANTTKALYYNNTTGEISYDIVPNTPFANVASTVSNNAQPNITSLGTLTSVSVSGNANVGNLGTTGVFATTLSATGTLNAGNIITGGLVSATGNITSSGRFVGNGSGLTQLTGANVTGTVANATYATSTGSIPISNVNSGNYSILLSNGNSNIAANTAFNFNVTTGNLTIPGILTALLSSAAANQSNITGLGTLTSLSVTGAATVGSLVTGGTISATGNIIGNRFVNGNSNISITANSNVTISANGNANILTVYYSNATTRGVSINGNLTAGNISTGGAIFATGNITANTGYFYIGNGSQLTGITSVSSTTAGTVTTNAQPNITSVGTMTALNVVGNVGIGEVGTAGNLTVVGGQLRTSLDAYFQAGIYGTWLANTGNFSTPNANITTTLTTPSLLASNINFSGTLSSNNAPNTAVNLTISRKLPIVLNGTTYYICLTTSV